MPNTWFRFKKFKIEHSQCAMKVGTDGVLLGAWAGKNLNPKRILDVGAGTGLIALMCAQRFPNAVIDALEIEPFCFQQCVENINNSPWPNQIKPICGDFFEFTKQPCPLQYDLIVSNPPYFKNSFKPPQAERQLARHATDAFPLEALLGNAARILNPGGKLCVIIPYDQLNLIKSAAALNHLQLNNLLFIKGREGAPIKRVLLELTSTDIPQEVIHEELILEIGRNLRSKKYYALTKEFYL